MKLPKPKSRQFQSLITLFTMTIALMPMLVSAADDKAKKEKLKAPEIDIFQATINGDTEAIKQHVAAGTNVNSKEPSLGSTPLGIDC